MGVGRGDYFGWWTMVLGETCLVLVGYALDIVLGYVCAVFCRYGGGSRGVIEYHDFFVEGAWWVGTG